jgi:Zn-dependent metalloprotease
VLFGGGPTPRHLFALGGVFEFPEAALQASTTLDSVLAFFGHYAPLFAPSSGRVEATLIRSTVAKSGATVVRAHQTANGKRIRSADFVAHVVPGEGLHLFHGSLVDVPAYLDDHVASPEAVIEGVKLQHPELVHFATAPEALYQRPSAIQESTTLSAVWRVIAHDEAKAPFEVWVDDSNGNVLEKRSLLRHALERVVGDSGDAQDYTGTLLYDEGAPYCVYCSPTNDPFCTCESVSDPELGPGIEHIQTVYDFWDSRFGWQSYDGADATMGMNLRFLMEEPDEVEAAFWNGYTLDFSGTGLTERVYIDRDNANLDFIAHEFAHGFNQYTANLDNEKHPGAIDEHLADCFAALVSDDWELFEETQYSHLYGARSVKYPNLSYEPWARCSEVSCLWPGQPDRWTRFATDEKDGHLVHQNSGIGNKVCYLVGNDGERTFNGTPVAGVGRDRAAELFHILQRDYLSSTSTYFDYAIYIIISAISVDSDTLFAANDAVSAVGLWYPPLEVTNSETTDRRPAATTHTLTGGAKVTVIAYRRASDGALRVQIDNAGWGMPFTPSCFSGETLLSAPTFAKATDPQSDDVLYAVIDDSGTPTIVRADLINGVVTNCTTPYASSTISEQAISAIATASDDYVFFVDTSDQVKVVDSGGMSLVGQQKREYSLTDDLTSCHGGVSAMVQEESGATPLVYITTGKCTNNERNRAVEISTGTIEQVLAREPLNTWPLGDLADSAEVLNNYNLTDGYLAPSVEETFVDSHNITGRWSPYEPPSPDTLGEFTADVAFVRDDEELTTEDYSEFPLARATISFGYLAESLPERIVAQPITDVVHIGEAVEIESAPSVKVQFFTTSTGSIQYVLTSGR